MQQRPAERLNLSKDSGRERKPASTLCPGDRSNSNSGTAGVSKNNRKFVLGR